MNVLLFIMSLVEAIPSWIIYLLFSDKITVLFIFSLGLSRIPFFLSDNDIDTILKYENIIPKVIYILIIFLVEGFLAYSIFFITTGTWFSTNWLVLFAILLTTIYFVVLPFFMLCKKLRGLTQWVARGYSIPMALWYIIMIFYKIVLH